MTFTFKRLRRAVSDISLIIIRNSLLPINVIIIAVVVLLILLGNVREGLFLGATVLVNSLLSIIQDIRAWILLQRLELLTMRYVVRVDNQGVESNIAYEDVQTNDILKLTLGDQAPCDAIVTATNNLEINTALITGESTSVACSIGSSIAAGSTVTTGTATVRALSSFSDSRIATMTSGLKRYSAHPSPIQISIQRIIHYTLWILLASCVFVVLRGFLLHESLILMAEHIGALASTLVPQGLVVATTLLFTLGAWHFYNRNVLLQEINATEKFGRIKNLCMDKTGTLTENLLTVDNVHVHPGTQEKDALECAWLYVKYSGDSSQSISAIERHVTNSAVSDRTILNALPFSAWRRYGGIAFKHAIGTDTASAQNKIILMGPPETFAPHMMRGADSSWLLTTSTNAAREGKQLLALVTMPGEAVPQELHEKSLTPIAVFELENKLRAGVQDAVNFFQKRNVTLRILSGDHPMTVQSVAKRAGILHSEAIMTGPQMALWTESDYEQNAHKYSLYARVEPEQKERLIEAFKRNGFTAMIGDGINDALSVKKADLGIALFDGAKVTRQIAAVVLLKNSFIELPSGVRMAASMIENIEIFTALYLNQTIVLFLLFVALSLLGYDFSLTPMNVTLINYFTVGISGILISWWAATPSEKQIPEHTEGLLKRVVPLPLWLSIPQIVALVSVFIICRTIMPAEPISGLLVVSVILQSYIFLVLAAEYVSNGLTFEKRRALLLCALAEIVLLYATYHTPVVLEFFGTAVVSMRPVIVIAIVAALCALVQIMIVKVFLSKKTSAQAIHSTE